MCQLTDQEQRRAAKVSGGEVTVIALTESSIRPTRENLETLAIKPLMRWLIAAALDNSTVTYGEAKQRLETEVGFTTIFSTKMGRPAGALINRIHEVDPAAPLINVILVNQVDRLPSDGAGSFMARRFGQPSLAKLDARERHPERWRLAFERAAGEVYAYGEQRWSELFERVFGEPYASDAIQEERKTRKKGSEHDGVCYGRSGEGPNHRALRLWVQANPQALHRSLAGVRSETEVDLDSGDRVDVVFYAEDRTIVIEVKSRDSDLIDLRRGVFQCIKYRAVQSAMDVRSKPVVEPMLVTESLLPGEIRELLKLHKIGHKIVTLDR